MSVDTVAPSVSKVQLPPAGTYFPGTQLRLVVDFTEVVLVKGSVWIDVLLGNQVRRFVRTAGCGSRQLIFTYRLTKLDPELNGLQLPAEISLANGLISDLAGNPAKLKLPVMTEANLVIRKR